MFSFLDKFCSVQMLGCDNLSLLGIFLDILGFCIITCSLLTKYKFNEDADAAHTTAKLYDRLSVNEKFVEFSELIGEFQKLLNKSMEADRDPQWSNDIAVIKKQIQDIKIRNKGQISWYQEKIILHANKSVELLNSGIIIEIKGLKIGSTLIILGFIFQFIGGLPC